MRYPERYCPVCAKPFRPSKPNAVTCSGRCRTRRHRRGAASNLIDQINNELANAIPTASLLKKGSELKKVGRPKKAVTAAIADVTPKKRGRPKKVVTPPTRGRGITG